MPANTTGIDAIVTKDAANVPKLKILYVMGCGRSGSTVLDALLGSRPDTVGVGELHMLNHSLAANDYCSCHRPIRDCEFWAEVMRAWHPTASEVHQRYVALQRKYESLRVFGSASWLRLWRQRLTGRTQELQTYLNDTHQLYEAIAKVSGSRVIVESSKLPIRAAILSQITEVDLSLIHLVRDVRGVVWSCCKTFAAEADKGVASAQSGRSLLRTVTYWSVVNRIADQVCRANKSLRLRYEDLVVNPIHSLQAIERLADLKPATDQLAASDRVSGGNATDLTLPLQMGHLFSGNRLRMATQLTLRADTEWYDRMPQSQRRWAKFWAQPLLNSYGYTDARQSS